MVDRLHGRSFFGRVAQLVEHLPEEQGVTGSIPVASTTFAPVAQLVVQRTCNAQVVSSNLTGSSICQAA